MDHTELVKQYVKRDKEFNLDKVQLIQKSINKLGYNYVNLENEINKNIKYNYIKDIDNLENISFNEYKLIFSNKIREHVMNKINRSVVLSKFIGTSSNEEFYMSCTVEELEYLGF